MKPDTRFIILHETVISSWLKDAGTFGSIGLLAWFNHTHLGGTWVLDVLAVVFVCGMMVRAFSSRVATVTENELVYWALERAVDKGRGKTLDAMLDDILSERAG